MKKWHMHLEEIVFPCAQQSLDLENNIFFKISQVVSFWKTSQGGGGGGGHFHLQNTGLTHATLNIYY